jgi:hypothetical protein
VRIIAVDPIALKPNFFIARGATPSVLGAGVAPEIEVKSNPYRFRDTWEQVTRIGFQVDQDAQVTVKILPPGVTDPAQAIATLADGVAMLADTVQEFEWRAHDPVDTNLLQADHLDGTGIYTFYIEAVGDVTGFTTTYRGAIQVIH